MSTSLEQKLNRLSGKNGENEKVEKLKKGGKTPGHGSLSDNGGARKGAGRKTKAETAEARGLKADAEDHYKGSVDVKVTDPKTGRERVMKQKRLLIVLDQLFKAAAKGDVDAANKWLDRALGKPIQPLGGDDDHPILLKIDF